MASRTTVQCLRVLLYPLQFDTSASALDDYFEQRFRDSFRRDRSAEEIAELREACRTALERGAEVIEPVADEWSLSPDTLTDILSRFVSAFDRWFPAASR